MDRNVDFKQEPPEDQPATPSDHFDSGRQQQVHSSPHTVVTTGDLPLDAKFKELESKQNLRLYLMKSWNVLQSGGGQTTAELTNSEIRKLLMSPPQSPSINSTSKEATTGALINSSGHSSFLGGDDQDLDSTNDSSDTTALVMALEDDQQQNQQHQQSHHQHFVLQTSPASTKDKDRDVAQTILKTLQSPLSDGIYTYWAVVKASAAAGGGQNNKCSGNR